MCFPSKSQKALYSDDQAQPDTKAPAPAPVSTTTTTPLDLSMAPNVAIVIYTLYGHIAKCASLLLFIPMSHLSLIHLCSPPSLVAEAEKKGIEAAGGTATIYQ